MAYQINVVSNSGHDSFDFKTREEAVQRAQEISRRDNKWIYVGPNYVSADALTPEMVEEDTPLTLTNPLVGG